MRFKVKILAITMFVVLLAVSVFTLSACNGGGDQPDNRPPASTAPDGNMITPLTAFDAVYGQTLADLVLPVVTSPAAPLIAGTWAWVEPATTSVGNAGHRYFDVRFNPADTVFFSVIRQVRVNVIQANLPVEAVTTPEPLNAVFGQTLADLTLPVVTAPVLPLIAGVWTWVEPVTTPVGDAGDRYFETVFAPVNTNFASVTRKVRVNVSPLAAPAAPVLDAVMWVDGLTLAGIVLPTGWAWENQATILNAGTSNHPANFVLANHQSANNVMVSVTINPITAPGVPTPSVIWTNGLTLADVSLPEGWTWVNSAVSLSVGDNQQFPANFALVNHQSASALISVTVNPIPTPEVPVPEAVAWTSALTLADIILPAGWTWAIPATILNAGTANFPANFAWANHQPATNVNIFVTVTPTPTPNAPTVEPVVWISTLTLADITLPAGWTWATPEEALNASNNQQKPANFALANHISATNVMISVTVDPAPVPAVPTVTTAVWSAGLTLADFDLPAGWTWANPDTILNAGSNQQHPANFSLANHESENNILISVTVTPAPAPAAPKTFPTAWFYGITLADVPLMYGWIWAAPETPLVIGTADFSAVFNVANHMTAESQISVTVDLMVFAGFASQTLGDVTLPTGWEWVAPPATPVGAVGLREHNARNTATNETFVLVVDVVVFVSVSTGDHHALALDSRGRIWSWGSDAHGRTGHGIASEEGNTPRPRLITHVFDRDTNNLITAPVFTAVSASGGSGHSALYSGFSIALDYYGNLWTWGGNASGRTGHGVTAGNILRPRMITQVYDRDTNNLITAPVFTAADVGAAHGMALCEDGRVWTWGFNSGARTGQGIAGQGAILRPRMITVVFENPVTFPLETNNAVNIATIAIGHNAFPVFTLITAGVHSGFAIDDNYNIWSWGTNANGTTGHGITPDATFRPRRIALIYAQVEGEWTTPPTPNFVTVSAWYRSAAAICQGGHLWTWGNNTVHQTGQGTNHGNFTRPHRLTQGFNGDNQSPPVSLPKFSTVRVGWGWMSALCEDGDIWTWGVNGAGRTGHGIVSMDTNRPRLITEFIGVASGNTPPGFVALGGGDSAGTAICEDGRIWSWGNNQFGITGHGVNSGNTLRPRQITEPA